MTLRYACFLSYQRGNDLLDRFVRELFQALSNELALLTNIPLWFDTARSPGEFLNQAVADALSSSACMVPILTPTYFSHDRPYCSREYLGMQLIEARREEITGRRESIIIPVVFRGLDRLPKTVVQRSVLVDFSDYLAFGPKQFRSRTFARSVSNLSERIANLCEVYRDLDATQFTGFVLPSSYAAHQWLNSMGVSGSGDTIPFPSKNA